jgi:hypothetical protein
MEYSPIARPTDLEEEVSMEHTQPMAAVSTWTLLLQAPLRRRCAHVVLVGGMLVAAVAFSGLSRGRSAPHVASMRGGPRSESAVSMFSEDHPALQGVKVFEVLAATSETCDSYGHIRLLSVEHNNLGGHGPDSGDEGIRYAAVLSGAGTDGMEIFVEVHAPSSYVPASNSSNGLSEGLRGEPLKRLCKDRRCEDATNFGAISLPSGSEVNLTMSFLTKEKRVVSLDGISLTWFDLDTEPCAGWPLCEPESVESVTPVGNYSAYVSKHKQVKYTLKDDRATFTARQEGDGSDNPVNSRLMSQGEMDKAFTSVYTEVHEIEVTLEVTRGHDSVPRIFFFDFVPSLLCAETVPEWPAWMQVSSGSGDETVVPTTSTATTTRTATGSTLLGTSTTTTTEYVATCKDYTLQCESPNSSGGRWDLRYMFGTLKCGFRKSTCWIESAVLEGLAWIGRTCFNLSRSVGTLFGGSPVVGVPTNTADPLVDAEDFAATATDGRSQPMTTENDDKSEPVTNDNLRAGINSLMK